MVKIYPILPVATVLDWDDKDLTVCFLRLFLSFS